MNPSRALQLPGRLRVAGLALSLVGLVACADPLAAGQPASFRNDVMAVLSKAGCNQGTCHGNQNGKNGFKLSLRGEDPAFDHGALTRDQLGRRIDLADPQQSLVLLKATAAVPHEGGRRMEPDSREYRILLDWIGSGAGDDRGSAPRIEQLQVEPREAVLIEPAREVQISVAGRFSDGSTRDLTALAVYEPSDPIVSIAAQGLARMEQPGETTVLVRYLDRQVPVRLALVPERPGFVWSAPPQFNYIDEHVDAKLRRLRINPSEVASDATFLRRACLDLLGMLPTADEARRFVADPRPDKRARLIDELLERPEFADYWALKWSDLLRNEEKVLDRKGVENFHHWIRRSLAAGKPLDQFARELIAARGSTYANPAANYYRANRDPVSRAEATAQLFLGIRLQCAKCHNHPFDRWTQDDYYSWAALFARVQYKIVENKRRDRNDHHEFDGEQVVWIDRQGEVESPRTGQPAPPRFLGSGEPLADDADRLEALAAWLASPANRRFAEAQVNRIWYHLLGRGIVEPIDDFRDTNPPSNPALLQALADDFIAHDFDLRHMLRVIMNSRTYQLSSVPDETNRDDEANFSRAAVRRLSAEPLLDALVQVTGAPVKFNGYPLGTRAAQLAGVRAVRDRERPPTSGEKFLQLFGKPPRLLTCECERSTETTLGQTVQLVSGAVLNELLTHPENRLSRLLASGQSDEEIVDELYWAALGRAPGPEEAQAALEHLRNSGDRRRALEDITWALVNAKEFLLRN